MLNATHGSANTRQSLVCVEHFHKMYDRLAAVTDLSFRLEPGQILGLVGPNGAGKTTTMKAVSGMIPPTQGRLTIGEFDVTVDPVKAKRVLSYIPDDPQLFSELSVAEHLAFTASVYQVANAEEQAAHLLREFELFDKRETAARDLSRGMRQKLAICCAYLHNPAVLLFDEPLTGLDPHGIRKVKQTIRERAAEGAGIVISSHLLGVVEDICTHLLILESGRNRFHGTLDELKRRYSEQGEVNLEEIFFFETSIVEMRQAAAEAEQPLPVQRVL
ncbi:MAG TPA: ABC transporter ATP-binding protein [Planctomycetaceae bacterium]|nr:ABC transporter ATP-binding protein [Planctomycetaceae bacterium]